MNATEQRRHATLAQKVEQVSEDVTQVVDGMDARVFELAQKLQDTQRQLNDLRVEHLIRVEHFKSYDQILTQLRRDRSYLVAEITESNARLCQFQTMTLWSRLCWLLGVWTPQS